MAVVWVPVRVVKKVPPWKCSIWDRYKTQTQQASCRTRDCRNRCVERLSRCGGCLRLTIRIMRCAKQEMMGIAMLYESADAARNKNALNHSRLPQRLCRYDSLCNETNSSPRIGNLITTPTISSAQVYPYYPHCPSPYLCC